MALVLVAAAAAGSSFDMFEESDKIWDWTEPEVYPPPWFEGMDLDTLSVLLDSGNLQWYEPRPTPGEWDAVVGAKIHAPSELVWKVITDYEGQCRFMNRTFMECETEGRRKNRVKNNYVIKTTVLKFGTTFDMIDLVTEDPPYHQHILTIDGGLKGRELDLILKPIDRGKNTLFFMRYNAQMKSLGLATQAILAVVPMAEWPVTAASANYHLRAQKNEAERLAGYSPPRKPKPLDYHALDVNTLRALARYNAGLIRETPEGKTINGLSYSFINAPPQTVWEVLADLEHYNDVFTNQHTTVERREGNKVWVNQVTRSQSVLVFTFDYEMHGIYTLEPTSHMSFLAVDGAYEGSTGDYYILSVEGGTSCVLFCAIGLNFEKDTALTTRIIRSGDYPFNTVMDLLAARSFLNSIKPEAESRAAKRQ
jgi:uncharacterized protein YndB with AHSA1/START domain